MEAGDGVMRALEAAYPCYGPAGRRVTWYK